ncbi:MAG: response regulator [Chloroflexota bacterium]|uniref:Response regulator transcription factor n=1 Tax=Bellilinea caldifistulae TaxID=360411 RepID=A0A7C4PZ29_9CHLR|nr:response regulator transcription factor [Bellilinea sp.]
MSEPHNPITVIIVDDHAVVRQGLIAFLQTQDDIEVIGEAENGVQLLELLPHSVPDVLLMDLIMPDMDGVEATRRVKTISPHTQVIIFTSYYKDEHIFPAVRAGALSYILKDSKPDELADAIRKASRGEAVLHPRVAARLVQEVQGARRETLNPFSELSDREMEILRLIASGISNREIAETLFISEKTVKSHVSNILSKLHLADRTQAAVYAWNQGIVRRDE